MPRQRPKRRLRKATLHDDGKLQAKFLIMTEQGMMFRYSKERHVFTESDGRTELNPAQVPQRVKELVTAHEFPVPEPWPAEDAPAPNKPAPKK